MGLLDKLKDTFAGDEKPKSFEVTFIEPKMGMTLSAGPTGEPLVTGGAGPVCVVCCVHPCS